MNIQSFEREWLKFNLPQPENTDREHDLVAGTEQFTFEVDSEPEETNLQKANEYLSEVYGSTLIEIGQSVGSFIVIVTIQSGFSL